jgi:mono/diheme cytochrome c family protein
MYIIAIIDFVGRFHPVLVHLPIGILLLGCLFHLFSFDRKIITIIIFWGMVSALLSALTGYFLSLSGDYEESLVNKHQWLGIISAVIAVLFYWLLKSQAKTPVTKSVAILLVLSIVITGHLGGSLTHGEGYLSDSFNEKKSKGPAIPPIADIQEAQVYASAIQPLFEARCYTCHGPNKMKGKLRLDKPELILKGGENGKVIIPGKTDESEMIERLLLPLSDEDHMPPKEKTQLTKNEIEVLHWWVANGADFNKKFRELPQPDNIKPVLLALQSGSSPQHDLSGIPEEDVKAPDAKTLHQLKAAGIVVIPVAQGSNYLSVNFLTAPSTVDSAMKLLQPVGPNILWLNLSGTKINDTQMKDIGKLKNISRLNLNNTTVSDAGIAELTGLSNLQYINLTGTQVSAKGLVTLAGLKKLKSIYLYRSKVTRTDWPALQKSFSGVALDSGGYTVPTLATDTTQIKY